MVLDTRANQNSATDLLWRRDVDSDGVLYQFAFKCIPSGYPLAGVLRPGTRLRVSRRTSEYARVPACGWGSSLPPRSPHECKLVLEAAVMCCLQLSLLGIRPLLAFGQSKLTRPSSQIPAALHEGIFIGPIFFA